MKPRLLDLFCGAGGAAMGYARAGFDVTGVDNKPQPRYPFEFHQGDAMTWPLDGYDVVHASPPCQDHSDLATIRGRHGTGWMLDATRERLIRSGLHYVIENVDSAPMPGALILCGSSFGLSANGRGLRRHRRFESNVFLMGPPCACPRRIVGFYGTGGPGQGNRGYKGSMAEARTAMGINWMTRAEVSQAIPPAYTQLVGEQLLDHLREQEQDHAQTTAAGHKK